MFAKKIVGQMVQQNITDEDNFVQFVTPDYLQTAALSLYNICMLL